MFCFVLSSFSFIGRNLPCCATSNVLLCLCFLLDVSVSERDGWAGNFHWTNTGDFCRSVLIFDSAIWWTWVVNSSRCRWVCRWTVVPCSPQYLRMLKPQTMLLMERWTYTIRRFMVVMGERQRSQCPSPKDERALSKSISLFLLLWMRGSYCVKRLYLSASLKALNWWWLLQKVITAPTLWLKGCFCIKMISLLVVIFERVFKCSIMFSD